MVYLAAGVSGLTAVVGTFFVKDYLGLSAAFLAGLTFWAGIPWALKMPIGHLVDLIWRWKALLVYLGAGLIAVSIGIMYALIAHTSALAEIMDVEAWYVLSALLAPTGYVVQDVVADAMTVEAVPLVDASVGGVVLGTVSLRSRARGLRRQGLDHDQIERMLFAPAEETKPNWWIFGGSIVFVAFIMVMGLGKVPLAQEVIFLGSMAIVLFLMYRLIIELKPNVRGPLIGTAIIIFVFRAVPLPGLGATWFEIDVLRFDQQFLSVLSLITSALALVGMILLRPMMGKRSIAYVVAVLTIAGGLLSLPNIGLYYGIQEWTAGWSGGIVDARFIAILDTAIESPLGQISMIPLLAWIAKNAPAHLKATFFAVMASFTNLALSASSLLTKYLNQIFFVTREVRDRLTGAIETAANYGDLGWLLITAALVSVLAPLITIVVVQHSKLRTHQ
jgi:hypothetical protein